MRGRLYHDCLQVRSNGCGLDMWICKVIELKPDQEFLRETAMKGDEWIEWAEMWASDMTPQEACKEYDRVYIGQPHIQEYIEPENNTGYEPE